MFDLATGLSLEPGAAERDVVARLAAVELAAFNSDNAAAGGLDPWSGGAALRERVAVCERLTRQAQARGLRAVAELVAAFERGSSVGSVGYLASQIAEFAVDLVAAELGVSRRTAEVRVEDAVVLTTRLPKMLAALEAGIVSLPVVRVLAAETTTTELTACAEVEARVLDRLGRGVVKDLGRMTPEEIGLWALLHPGLVSQVGMQATGGRVRALTRRVVGEVDADAVRKARERARAERDVELMQGLPGMVWLGAQVPEAQGVAAYDRIDTLARQIAADPEETRTLAQVRADVFTDLLLSSGPEGLADGAAVPLNVKVTIDAAGAAITEHAGAVGPEALAELMAIARASGGSVVVRTVTPVDCPGQHPTPGPYQPSEATRAMVIGRDVTCRFPGCVVPSSACDLDHTIPHPRGPTCPCNLCALCRHHHRLKTFGGWTLTNHGDGHLTWRSPTGRTYDIWPDTP